jgi:hypothetical protein
LNTEKERTQWAAVRAGESYLSSNDPRLHFGLGAATEAEIEVRWPAGGAQKVSGVKANQELLIREEVGTRVPPPPK